MVTLGVEDGCTVFGGAHRYGKYTGVGTSMSLG